jgi:hypothetical protein
MKAKLGLRAAHQSDSAQDSSDLLHQGQKEVEYDEALWATWDALREKRLEVKLKRQAKRLDYQLVPIEHNAA